MPDVDAFDETRGAKPTARVSVGEENGVEHYGHNGQYGNVPHDV
jgi:hypothetical protein